MKNNFKAIARNSVFSFLILATGPNFVQAHSSFVTFDPHFQSVRGHSEARENRIEGQRLIEKGKLEIARGHIKSGQRKIAQGQALLDLSRRERHEEHHDRKHHRHDHSHRW